MKRSLYVALAMFLWNGAGQVWATSYYWDTNDVASGAGGASPSGVWDGANAYWSTNSGGTAGVFSATTTTNDDLTFSAGTDATSAYTVTLSGTQNAKSMTFEDGTVTLSGGTLQLANTATITISGARTAFLDTTVSGPGTSLTVDTDNQGGYVTLTGAGTFTGDTIVSGRAHGNYSSSPSLVLSNAVGSALQSTNVYLGRVSNSGHATIWCKKNSQFGNNPVLNMNEAQYSFLDLFGTTQTVAGVQGFNGAGGFATVENTPVAGTAGVNGLLTINTPSGATYSCLGIYRDYSGSAGTLGTLAVIKDGAGIQKLTSGSGVNVAWYGPTTVKAGRFEVDSLVNSPTWDIQGGTLAIVKAAAGNGAGKATRLTSSTGSGTFEVNLYQASNTFDPFATASAKTISLSQGSLIYVKQGTFRMANGNNATWTNNMAGLTVDTNGVFDMYLTPTTGNSPMVDALNGTGTITDSSGTNILTVGIAGGSGTFSGVITQGAGSLVGLKKIGSGTQTLSGVSTYTGSTLIQAGTLALGVSNALGGSINIILANNATVDVSAVTYAWPAWQALQGTGCVAGATTVPSTSQFVSANRMPGDKLTFVNDLTLAAGATLWFDVNGTNADWVSVLGTLSPNNGHIGITVPSGATNGVYWLIDYTALFGSFDANVVTSSRKTMTLTNATGKIGVVISGTDSANLVWRPAVSGDWDVTTSSNWFNTGKSAGDVFYAQDTVTFDDGGAGTNTVSLVGTMTPLAVTVNSLSNYTLSGSGKLTGPTGFTKSGSGTLVLATVNDFVGAFTVGTNGGVIRAESSSAFGTGAVTVGPGAGMELNGGVTISNSLLTVSADGVGGTGVLRSLDGSNSYSGSLVISTNARINVDSGVLTLSNSVALAAQKGLTVGGSGTLVQNGGLSGVGTVGKDGAGVLKLNGSGIAYTGTTTINAGTLILSNATSFASSTTIAGGATLTISTTGGSAGGAGILAMSSGSRTFSGTGVLTLSGSGYVNVGGNLGIVNFNMGTGTFIDIASPDVQLGGAVNATMGANNAGLNLSSGSALHLSQPGGMQVDALTGSGNLNNAYYNTIPMITVGVAGTQNNASYGVSNNTAIFSGTIGYTETYNGGVVWSLKFTKVGAGTQVLTGANGYGGGTTVSNGVLLVNNTTGSGTGTNVVNVISNAIFGGTGIVAGPVNVAAGGILAPGGSPLDAGLLRVSNNVTFSPDAVFAVQLSSNGLCDTVACSRTNVVEGAVLSCSLLGSEYPVGTRYVVALAAVISGTFTNCPDGSRIKIGPKAFNISYPGHTNVVLQVAETGLLLLVQ